MYSEAVAVLVVFVTIFTLYTRWRYKFWQKKGLESPPVITPYGNARELFLNTQSIGDYFKGIYDYFKAKKLAHGGAYIGLSPIYIPVDTEIVKNIMQRDFEHFVNHTNYINESNDPLTGHLFSLKDTKWRNMRVKLTPTFTSGKMKMMFQTLADCTSELTEIINKSAFAHAPIDIKDVFARFTTDIISSCAFGIESNSLKDPNVEFRRYGRKVFETDKWEMLKITLAMALPHKFLDLIKFRVTKPDVEEFFINVVKETVRYREENRIFRKDFMHLLIQLKNRGKVSADECDESLLNAAGDVKENLSINELAAQAFVFFLAGFETSSTTSTFLLYELAVNAEIQDKLRNEIRTVLAKNGGKLTYDSIMEMTYMDRVISETLRKYPPVPMHSRECSKDYAVPNTDVKIKKGTAVAISALGIQMDPEYYPEPKKFDPDRFTEENKNKRPVFSWIPFGEGPRVCIGLRFGVMQTKVGLAAVLANYKFKLNPKTKTPLKMETTSFILTAEGGVWLDVEKV